MTTTIVIDFDASTLPRWAQVQPAVVERCKVDLAYRCRVADAKYIDTRYRLIDDAKRWLRDRRREV